jgi:peptide subunit release factor 1 (eRF1)
MAIVIACTHCGKTGKVPDNYVGRKVKCPKCKKDFIAAAAKAEEEVLVPEVVEEETLVGEVVEEEALVAEVVDEGLDVPMVAEVIEDEVEEVEIVDEERPKRKPKPRR